MVLGTDGNIPIPLLISAIFLTSSLILCKDVPLEIKISRTHVDGDLLFIMLKEDTSHFHKLHMAILNPASGLKSGTTMEYPRLIFWLASSA
jgi:hypothetical protein